MSRQKQHSCLDSCWCSLEAEWLEPFCFICNIKKILIKSIPVWFNTILIHQSSAYVSVFTHRTCVVPMVSRRVLRTDVCKTFSN